ncbi:ATP-dependent protease [Flavobacteriaceae bacterium R38]|nr:ATP-dependent protease [Flavobacteriaceae bacterium R38]
MNILPMFPLQIVVYPNDKVPLHIFEKRYQELIADCEETGMSFGIPVVIDGKISFGTEVKLTKVVKRYNDGRSDIICSGQKVFKIQKFYEQLENKSYAGGEVQFFDDIDDSVDSLKLKIIERIKEFYNILDLEVPELNEQHFSSYDLAHRIGFSFSQEYELLQLRYESERLNYILNHLKNVIPIIKQVNHTKDTIKLNGHFKSFDPMDFKNIKWE